jgi:hypothetical protein
MFRIPISILALVLLAGCSGGSGGTANPPPAAAKPAPAPPVKTVFDDQLKALQKARDVKNTLDADAKRTDEELDKGDD